MPRMPDVRVHKLPRRPDKSKNLAFRVVKIDQLQDDPRAFRARFQRLAEFGFEIRSAGPDVKWATTDDLRLFHEFRHNEAVSDDDEPLPTNPAALAAAKKKKKAKSTAFNLDKVQLNVTWLGSDKKKTTKKKRKKRKKKKKRVIIIKDDR